MKHNYSLKAALLSLVCLLMLTLLLQSSAQATLQEEVDRFRYKYETLYKQYTESLKENVNSRSIELSEKMKVAKRQYQEALEKFRMKQSTKDKIKESAAKVTDTLGDVFATGGASAPEFTAQGNHELPGYATMPISIDGDNYCGQFAMTSALNGMGIPSSAQDNYKATNPAGIFTAPPVIVEHLRMNGVKASEKHNAGIEDIIKKLDDGKPVLALVDSGSGVPHWINIYGYKTDSEGKVVSLTMRDSYWGTKKGHEMDIEKFKTLWEKPLGTNVLSKLSGYKNLLVEIDGVQEPQKSPHLLNFNFWTATEDNVAAGINDVVTGFKNLSPTQFAGGLTKCVLGIPGAVIGLSANGVNALGDKIIDYGRNKFAQAGAGNKILGGASMMAGGLAKGVGFVGKAAGNLASGVASVAGNFFKKLGYVFR